MSLYENNINIEPDLTKYKHYTELEAYEEFGYAAETDGNGVNRWHDGKADVAIAYSTEVDAYAFDIYVDGEYMGVGFGETPYESLLSAIIECNGYETLRENPNMEDAMNILCYGTFAVLYGDIFKSRFVEVQDDGRETSEVLDVLWHLAAEFVKKHCKAYGFEYDMSWAE